MTLDIEKEKTTRFIKLVENLSSLARVAIQFGFVYLSVLAITEPLEAFAGKTTDANIVINVLYEVLFGEKINTALNLSGWGVGIAWALLERRSKKRSTKRFHVRIKELELKIDPERSSSKLTEKGETRPEDR